MASISNTVHSARSDQLAPVQEPVALLHAAMVSVLGLRVGETGRFGACNLNIIIAGACLAPSALLQHAAACACSPQNSPLQQTRSAGSTVTVCWSYSPCGKCISSCRSVTMHFVYNLSIQEALVSLMIHSCCILFCDAPKPKRQFKQVYHELLTLYTRLQLRISRH
jgi:hypothetical protein